MTTGKEDMLDVHRLRRSYRTAARTVDAVGNVTFSVAEGELACVVGPSGCGKTTLLRCIAGLLAPSGGTVAVDGREVSGPPAETAVVFQEYGRSLFPWLRAGENVALPLRPRGLSGRERRARVAEALKAVDLAGAERAYPWELSGGMQQRVAIARAIAYRPKLLLMDEPFAAVDAQTRADLEDLILGLWRDLGITVLFITHDIDEAVYLGQRVLVLSASPTVVMEDVAVDLPASRDQLTTRADPRFAALRSKVYRLIRSAHGERGE